MYRPPGPSRATGTPQDNRKRSGLRGSRHRGGIGSLVITPAEVGSRFSLGLCTYCRHEAGCESVNPANLDSAKATAGSAGSVGVESGVGTAGGGAAAEPAACDLRGAAAPVQPSKLLES